MKAPRRITAVVVLGAAAAVVALGCALPEPEEKVDESRAFVVNGTADTTAGASYPASVRINGQGCSGTLITPYWVMTAQHCYTDPGDLTGTDNVWLGANAAPNGDPGNCPSDGGVSGSNPFCKRTHSLWTSGPILVWDQSPDHRENDLALVRLDAPAPAPWALPAHPPTTTSACGGTGSMLGRLVGYGPTGYNENGYGCPGGAIGTRRFGAPFSWSWDDGNVIGSTRRHTFFSDPLQGCNDMTGIGVGGDSGGSLYDSSGTFCGVVSGDGYWACSGDNESDLECEYHTVAVNDPNAIAWWSQYVFDVDGNWEGEIPATAANDPDGDGIASQLDNCPLVWNPEQLTTFDDPDGNGLGAACQSCPELSNLYNNRNREVELAVRYPTATSMPVLTTGNSAAQQYYLQSFVPDACDPHPAPTMSLGEGGHLPPGTSVPQVDPLDPICVMFTHGCKGTTRNKITVYPVSSPVVNAAGGTDERIGLRWCDCQDVPGFDDSLEGRARCRNDLFAGCTFSETRYDEVNSKWLKVTTPDLDLGPGEQPWDNPVLGQEWVVPAGGQPFTVSWDYTALGPTHVGTGAKSQGVAGMLWAHVAELTNSAVPIAPLNVRTYANALAHGNAGSWVHPAGHLWVAVNDWIECPMCGPGIRQVLYETSNPWWNVATADGPELVGEIASPATLQHFDAVGAGTRLHVAASEPVALLATSLAPTQTYTRALGLTTRGAVAAKLFTTGLEGVPTAEAYTVSGGPSFVRGEGLAFSAFEQRLYVLGGLTSGGEPKNMGWFLNLSTSTWREFTMPSGEKVGEVLAMTYRHKDRAIYYLDRSDGKLRLRRWNAQRKLTSGVLVTLATFPSGWDAFGKYAVIAGPRGEIAVVGWQGTGSEKARIGYFKTDEAHRISAAGLAKLETDLLAAPAMTYDGFAIQLGLKAPRRPPSCSPPCRETGRARRRASRLTSMRCAPLSVSVLVILAACSDGHGSGATSSGSSGGGALSSSKSTVSSSSSGSTGTGSGGDAAWTLVPWHAGQCQFEYAKKPEHAFPELEWTSCPANEAGCERLVKNWPHETLTGIAPPAVRRSESGYQVALPILYPDLEQRIVFLNHEGIATAAYRAVPGTGCLAGGPGWSAAGHWIGVQEIALPEPASYVFQPIGEPAEAAQSLPITRLTNSQRGNDNLFTALLDFSKGIELYDRTTGQLHSTPTSFLSVDAPRLIDDTALFLAYSSYNQPQAWVWTRTAGYQKLIDPAPNRVVDVNGDGQTLVWIEAPPKAEPNEWPPGTLYTAPYVTTASEVVGTPRATVGSQPPGTTAMGMGYYAFAAAEGVIQIVRVSDAQRWTYTVPVDEWRAKLDRVSYIDDTYLFFKTETNIYRQRLDVLGPGEPATLD